MSIHNRITDAERRPLLVEARRLIAEGKDSYICHALDKARENLGLCEASSKMLQDEILAGIQIGDTSSNETFECWFDDAVPAAIWYPFVCCHNTYYTITRLARLAWLDKLIWEEDQRATELPSHIARYERPAP